MASFNFFEDFFRALALEEHNLNTDTLKVYLTNNVPSTSADSVKTDLVGITEENGYAAADITNTYSETSGTGTLASADTVVWTASGGALETFRYIVLYNEDHASDGLIGWWDYGSAVTVLTGESFTVDFGASIFTIASA